MDERAFPYIFECVDCPDDSEITITYDEAVNELPAGLDPSDTTPRRAVNNVLVSKGWWRKRGQILCPACMERLK